MINFSNSLTNLGFIFNTSLNWDAHVASICGKVTGVLQNLRKFHCLSQNMKLKLFKSLILPFFNYGDVFLFSLSEHSKQRLKKCLNDCVRFIYNLRLGDHVSHLQKNLIGCPLMVYYDFRATVFIHKLLLTRCPEYLYEKLIISDALRTHNDL